MRKRLLDLAVWLAIFLCGCLLASALVSTSYAASVCIEEKDAMELALADTQGTASALWETKVAEGRCGNFPEAYYVRTISVYVDKEHVPSRVVELCLWGQRVWGLITGLPRGVWPV